MSEPNELEVPKSDDEFNWETVAPDLAQLYAIAEPAQQEYELIRQAKRHQIATEDYRRIFEAYYSQRKAPKWFKNHLFAPIVRIEKQRELLAYWCSRADLFKLLNYLGSLSIVLALATIWLQMYQMADQKQSEQNRLIREAWETITNAEGHKTNAGRTKAIEFLFQQKQSLTGLDVAKAYLVGINLPGAGLQEANFQQATLSEANLQKAELYQVNFRDANLWHANLQEAHLNWANLQGASLHTAQLQKAILSSTNLKGTEIPEANLHEANLNSASLQGANLKGAKLALANLKQANLQPFSRFEENLNPEYMKARFSQCDKLPKSFRKTNLKDADLRGANLTEAKLNCANIENADFRGTENTLTPEQIKAAENWEKAIYSPAFCEKLGLSNCRQEK